jgi:hypothetical protein
LLFASSEGKSVVHPRRNLSSILGAVSRTTLFFALDPTRPPGRSFNALLAEGGTVVVAGVRNLTALRSLGLR